MLISWLLVMPMSQMYISGLRRSTWICDNNSCCKERKEIDGNQVDGLKKREERN
jgi:hypothetical protein